MKILFIAFSILVGLKSNAQLTPEHFGYRHFQIEFGQDKVDILVRSATSEENIKKPLFFSVQGSMAVPLIVHNGERRISGVSLAEGSVEDEYHFAIVGKPGIPLMCHKDSLSDRRVYKNPETGKLPKAYIENNHLQYYIKRNNKVIEFLKDQDWVDTSRIVISGHSEGSTIAAHMADKIEGITHLIYSAGLPYYSRILAMLQKERKMEKKEENPWVQKTLDYWGDVLKHPYAIDRNKGWDTNLGTYSFSQSENEVLKRLKIPILISYGTEDESSPYNDMFIIEAMNDGVEHITFKPYVGLNHNYFGLNEQNEVDYEKDNLSLVVSDWLNWLKEN